MGSDLWGSNLVGCCQVGGLLSVETTQASVQLDNLSYSSVDNAMQTHKVYH